MWFSAAGLRNYGNGSLYSVGSNGFFWSAVPYNTTGSCDLGFALGYVSPQAAETRANGLSVRPVAEPKTRVTPKLPGSTEEDWSNNEDLDAGDIDI